MNIKLELLKSSNKLKKTKEQKNKDFFDLLKMVQNNKFSSDVKIFSEGVNEDHFEFKVIIYNNDIYYLTYTDVLIYNYTHIR